MMSLGLNPQEAGDLKATVQFEISGDEEFVAYLDIAEGKCAFVEGPAARPNLVIKARPRCGWTSPRAAWTARPPL